MRSPEPALTVPGVQLIELTYVTDPRGSLVAMEADAHVPFTPVRCFVVVDVPPSQTRGAHAHRLCEQLLVCIRGSLVALVDNGTHRAHVVLDRPDLGLYMPSMIWGSQFQYSPDAVLLVLASRPYEEDDYIRDYAQFLDAVTPGR